MLPLSVCELFRLLVEVPMLGLESGLGLAGLDGLGVGLVLVGVYWD